MPTFTRTPTRDRSAICGIRACPGAAEIRTRAGERLNSPALVADGNHARADAYVSLAVIASAVAVAVGAQVLDPLIGLGITAVILRITWQWWRTVRAYGRHEHHHN